MPRPVGSSKSAALEQYYSSESVSRKIGDCIKKYVPRCDLYVDPAVGKGAVFQQFPDNTPRIGFDIDPKLRGRNVHKTRFESDWAQAKLRKRVAQLPSSAQRRTYRSARLAARHGAGTGKVCVATNPPFRQAPAWFRLVADYADYVVFLLPQQYARMAYWGRVPACFQLVRQELLSDSQFDYRQRDAQVPTVVQIWEKRSAAHAAFRAPPTYGDLDLGGAWHFAEWNSVEGRRDATLYMDVKTGALFKLSKGSIRRRDGLLYCNVRDPTDARTSRRPGSTGALIVCRDARVERRLLSLANAPSTRRWAAKMPNGTRPHFSRTELAWMWLAAVEPRQWQRILRQCGLANRDAGWMREVGLTEFDRRWFV